MKLTQFAESRQLTLAKAKKLIKEVLKEELVELNDEQCAIIDEYIAMAYNKQLPQGEQNQEITSLTSELDSKKIEYVIQTIGVKTLKKNANLYMKLVQETAYQLLTYTDDVLSKVQAIQAGKVAITLNQMSQNLAAVYSEFATPEIDLSVSQQLSDSDRQWLETQLALDSM